MQELIGISKIQVGSLPSLSLRYLRGLDKRQAQHIFTEGVLNLAVHILSQRGEIHRDILRGGIILSNFENGLLGLVVTDGKLKELNSEVVAGESAQEA